MWSGPRGTPGRWSETFDFLQDDRVDVSESGLPEKVYLDHDDTAVDLEVRDEVDEQECGVMLRLGHQVQLTDNVVGDDPFGPDHHDDDYRNRNYSIYPLAFTGEFGNLQAKGFFLSFLQDFPRAVQDLVEADAGGRECSRIATPESHQGYNEVSHRIRTKDGLLDVGRGTITGALAGEYFKDADSRSKNNTLNHKLESKLPFERFTTKTCETEENFGFRNEAHCNIDVRAMPAQLRTGQ